MPTAICPICKIRVEVDPDISEDERDTPDDSVVSWWRMSWHKLESGEYCSGSANKPTYQSIEGATLPPKYIEDVKFKEIPVVG